MRSTTHINDKEAQGIKKALMKKNADVTATAQETLDFYLNDRQYTEVHIVRCNMCNADLCLEVLNPQEAPKYLSSHTKGCRRIVLGTSGPLLSSRKRLDGLMGYRCGNLVPNPLYDAEKVLVDAFNKQQAELKEKDEPFAPDMVQQEQPLKMCGNNTIIAEIEKGIVPQVKAPVLHIPTIEPHHEALIKLQMAKNGHKPDIEKSADGKFLRQETFTTERLK